MKTIGQRIRELRKAQKRTLQDVGDLFSIKTSSVSNWETGKSTPTTEKLSKLARYFGTSVNYLLTGVDSKDSNPEPASLEPAEIGSFRVPVISYVQAGSWTTAEDPYPVGEGSQWLYTDQELSPSAFALTIRGDSMAPEYIDGERIIVEPALTPMPGDMVVAKNGSEEATFKKYRPRGVNEHGVEVFELVPLNTDYPTMYSDRQPIQIIGVVVEHRRKPRNRR
ncbi:MAG: hypothetical protein RLZZ200_2616 [Pseudomonadota bacterium]|jgi:SOS-response transcriptional repressor LexA